jgi:hypothetical protein
MKRDTLIEHMEVLIVCEKSGPFNLSYNSLLTTPKANIVVKPIVLVVKAKSTLTYTHCGKTCHSLETNDNRKRELPIVPTTIVKSTKPTTKTKNLTCQIKKNTYSSTLYYML